MRKIHTVFWASILQFNFIFSQQTNILSPKDTPLIDSCFNKNTVINNHAYFSPLILVNRTIVSIKNIKKELIDTSKIHFENNINTIVSINGVKKSFYHLYSKQHFLSISLGEFLKSKNKNSRIYHPIFIINDFYTTDTSLRITKKLTRRFTTKNLSLSKCNTIQKYTCFILNLTTNKEKRKMKKVPKPCYGVVVSNKK